MSPNSFYDQPTPSDSVNPTRFLVQATRTRVPQRKVPGRLRWTILLGHPTRPVRNPPAAPLGSFPRGRIPLGLPTRPGNNSTRVQAANHYSRACPQHGRVLSFQPSLHDMLLQTLSRHGRVLALPAVPSRRAAAGSMTCAGLTTAWPVSDIPATS